MEALAAHLSVAELSSSLDSCLWKENRAGEQLASTNVTITHTLSAQTSVHKTGHLACAVW